MKPIYTPKGRAKEYGELAINIYTGCNHGCTYCYAPLVLKKDRTTFHSVVEPRPGIVEATKRQIEREGITGKLIHLCFTCDPYPADIDTIPTREIIKVIKAAKNNVQILTKGGVRAERDFDILDSNDWFGITLTNSGNIPDENEPGAASPAERFKALINAKWAGIRTWVSLEPVIFPDFVYDVLADGSTVDLFKIGKMNYAKSAINWAEFGRKCERLCIEHGHNYYIKEDLRKLMGGGSDGTLTGVSLC